VLRHRIADLDENGTLPPRFKGLAHGGMKRQISGVLSPHKRRKTDGAAGTRAESRKEDAGGAGMPDSSDIEYYSELAPPPDSAREAEELTEKGKRDLVHRWLRRKLYEEVHEQVWLRSVE
jgi:hypothetical protein